jgi:peptidoglycan/LPS O-acetylase OafA/YrhL
MGFTLLAGAWFFYMRFSTSLMVASMYGVVVALGYSLVLTLFVCSGGWDVSAYAKICYACGALSYGVYLFHNLSPKIIGLLNFEFEATEMFFLSVSLTFIIAFLTYRAIDLPARNYGRSLSKKYQ